MWLVVSPFIHDFAAVGEKIKAVLQEAVSEVDLLTNCIIGSLNKLCGGETAMRESF